MNYNQFLGSLFSKKRAVRSLLAIRSVTLVLQSPQLAYPTVHIAGTNGKGSVATMVARGLSLSGYRVGLFTSPHLEKFEERISINGERISPEEIMELSDQVEECTSRLGIYLSFFEITTLVAFLYFRKKKVDVAVIETGLGGRLDPTNTVEPLVSVITSIGKDHMHTLGNSLEKIAYEKAGIIKPNIPVVVGPTCEYSAIVDKAKQRLIRSSKRSTFVEENQEIATCVLDQLQCDFVIPEEAKREAVAAQVPGRLERVEKGHKEIMLDGAHNPDACQRLVQALGWKKCDLMISFGKEKDVDCCLEHLKKISRHVYVVQADPARSLAVETLVDLCRQKGMDAQGYASLEEGYDAATQSTFPLLITGSFYLVGRCRGLLFDQKQDRCVVRV